MALIFGTKAFDLRPESWELGTNLYDSRTEAYSLGVGWTR